MQFRFDNVKTVPPARTGPAPARNTGRPPALAAILTEAGVKLHADITTSYQLWVEAHSAKRPPVPADLTWSATLSYEWRADQDKTLERANASTWRAYWTAMLDHGPTIYKQLQSLFARAVKADDLAVASKVGVAAQRCRGLIVDDVVTDPVRRQLPQWVWLTPDVVEVAATLDSSDQRIRIDDLRTLGVTMALVSVDEMPGLIAAQQAARQKAWHQELAESRFL